MSVNSHVSHDDKAMTISVSGRFDYSIYQSFRNAYRDALKPGMECRIDLSSTEYMDSSALGMLLLLREQAQQQRSRVVLRKPSDAIRKILTIAHFEQLFDME